MSESDTMFNERDRTCTAVLQLMLSTDPSYDNRTIASTLKMQIRTVQRAQGDENKVSGYGYGLWCCFKCGAHHATSYLRTRLESQTKVYLDVLKSVVIPCCNQVAGDKPWAPAHKSTETQAWFQKECYDFVPFSYWPPLLPRPEPSGLLRLVIRQEHHQHDLPQHQSQPDRRHPPSIHQAPAGASGSVSRRWLRVKAATLNRYQLYYII